LIITQLLFFILKMGCRHYVGLLLPFPFLQNTDRGIGFKLDIPIAKIAFGGLLF
jgi:hypothetical protein